jgi:type I restriction enzyme S subunit
MSQWRRYSKYKSSVVEWLGEVPKEWEQSRLRFLCSITTGSKNTEDSDPTGQYPFFVRADTVERLHTFSFNEEAILTAGDGAGVAKVFHYYNGKFDAHQRVYVLTRFKGILPKFLFLYFRQNLGDEVLKLSAKSTVESLRLPMLQNFPVLIPPFPEQHSIFSFLNIETARIDTIIEKKERQIELLQEKRASLIYQAVTKGIDPNVKMKESGIEWIGEVPEHWEILKNKWIYQEIDERSTTGKEELLTVSHITGVTPRSEKDVNMFLPLSFEGYKLCKKDDLAINTMWAFMGALGFSPCDGMVSPSYNIYRLKNRCVSKYFDYLYRTPAFIGEILRHSKGVWTSRLRLYPDEFLSIVSMIPPVDEQKKIVEHIDSIIENEKIPHCPHFRCGDGEDRCAGRVS